ncbi:MAG: prephenate dehydrogenase [Clostridia bacterium]|nr:prephenate dehydrogenase [Clostridia bacterium]
MIRSVGIVGLGLMGASFGRLLVQKGYKVFGADRDPAVMQKALLANAYTEPLTDKTAGETDLLVMAIFPRNFKAAAERYLPYMKKGAILSDFCGNKRIVTGAMKALAATYPDIVYCGGHPMAGREYSGVNHSSVRLFDNASMILVPVTEDLFVLSELKKFYLSLGFGEVVVTTPEKHDKMIAYTSQLCHVVSNAFIKSESAREHGGYSAGSYRDLTRVARLDPVMWSELMEDNRDYLTKELDFLIASLSKYRDALASGDESALRALLAEGDKIKREIDKR